MPRIMIASLMVWLPLLMLAVPVTAVGEVQGPHIRVTGIGEVETVPDMATFRVGISERGRDIESLKAAVDAHTRELLRLVARLDVPDKDVTSAQVYIRPEYEWDEGRRLFVGYVVGREVVIILRDLGRYSALVDGIITAGANELSGIELGTSRREQLEDEALHQAIRNGRAEADLMAEAAGTAIERIWRITAQAQHGPIMMRSMAMAEAADAAPVFEPGTISIRREVELVYLIE